VRTADRSFRGILKSVCGVCVRVCVCVCVVCVCGRVGVYVCLVWCVWFECGVCDV